MWVFRRQTFACRPLPILFAFYYYLFQITFFSQLHILTSFLVLGFGADNVFVLADSWRLFHKDPKFNSNTFTNLLPAYKQAFSAISNTFLTTDMAFVSTSVSPIMPISTFILYAAVVILVNYLYVIFFMPSAVMIQYYYFSKSCLFWRAKRPFYQTITWEAVKLVDLEELAAKKEQRLKSSVGSENVERVGLTQRFLGTLHEVHHQLRGCHGDCARVPCGNGARNLLRVQTQTSQRYREMVQ